MVGNKLDLVELDPNARQMNEKHVKLFLQRTEQENTPYYETSAKTGTNLDQLFLTVATKAVSKEKETRGEVVM